MALQDLCGALHRGGAGVAICADSFALSDDECVGTEHRAEVMLQAGIQATLVLTQAELLLGFLIHSLDPPVLIQRYK